MRRGVQSLVGAAVLVGAMLAWGLAPSIADPSWDVLVPPCSVTATFTGSIYGGPPYGFTQPVHLKRGQTVRASLTASEGATITECSASAPGGPYYLVFDPKGSTCTFTVSGDASQTCYVIVSASAPGTYTLDLALADPVHFSLYAMKAPSRIRARQRFT